MHDYARVNHIDLEQDLTVDEYYSVKSGLRIILSKIKSPKIYGYFTLLTEAENDEGLPHTLEHLIFLGSHKYPYKGLLDSLAYKCLSEGTNAWTSIDHTCYTIETFGMEGFSNILPIYLDFILNPTLADDMFLSEVHHIFENGTHNGVVYSEMKSIENNCENIIERTVITNLYPNEKSGYRFETGGTLDGLRKTNNSRVREYFKKFYKLDNFAIIIFGNFNNDDILNIIYEFEKYHLELNPDQVLAGVDSSTGEVNNPSAEELFIRHMQSPKRPWSEECNVERRNDSRIVKKYYPCNNLNNGQVCIAWRGCDWADFHTKLAISLLGNYLTDLTTSPVSKRLLEDKENTYCSGLDFALEDLKSNYFTIDIYDVVYKFRVATGAEKPQQGDQQQGDQQQGGEQQGGEQQGGEQQAEEQKTERPQSGQAPQESAPRLYDPKMNEVGEITRKCLQQVLEEPLNMDRMKNIIVRSYLQHLKDLEAAPQYLLNEFIIKYFIYGKSKEDLNNCLNLKKAYVDLLGEKENYWKEILKKFFVQNNYVEVRCYPSYKKAKQIELFERNLIENEQKKYGKEKLQEMAKHIRKIKEGFEKKPPKSCLNVVDSANPQNVLIEGLTVFRNFELLQKGDRKEDTSLEEWGKEGDNTNQDVSCENNKLLSTLEGDLKRLIFPIQLSHIPSNFVSINVLINSSNVDAELQKYIPLLSYLLFETDVEVNNTNVKCELFTEELIRHTINYCCNYGLGGNAKNFRAGSLGNILCIQIVGLYEHYEKLFDLLFLSMFKMILTVERMEIILKSAYQNLLQKKTKPKTLVVNMEYALRYLRQSTSGVISIGQQEIILELIEDKNNLNQLYDKLNTLKGQLFDLKNFVIAIDANFCKIKNIFSWYDRWFKISSPEEQSASSSDMHKKNYTVNAPYTEFTFNRANQTDFTNSGNEANHTDASNSGNAANVNNADKSSVEEKKTASPFDVAITNGAESKGEAEGSAPTDGANAPPMCKTNKKKSADKYICLGPSVHKNLKEYLSAEFEKEDKNFQLNLVKEKAYNGILCGLKSTDVSYLKLTVKVPAGYEHEDYCALLLLREFFCMTEGPLYNSIRGGGFAYECALDFNCIHGELSLRIYRSSDIISALKEALHIFDYYCKNEMKEDEISLAKSSAYYTIFNNQETISDRASQTIFLSIKNLPLNFYNSLLRKIEGITTKDLQKICHKYLSRIVNFRIDRTNALIGSTLCIVCCSDKMEEILDSLRKDVKVGPICSLSVTQLFHFLKEYDIAAALGGMPVDMVSDRVHRPVCSANVDDDEDDDDDSDDDDDEHNHYGHGGSLVGGDDYSASCADSTCSLLSEDDSYPGYSEGY
ncbi:insulinase, putative [Plasmodium knowlesi strain H]|uniref:Insulinase, putative n=3 Tax=Plasmodium knowlesi TaxID=5850 RepID=A0A5K1UH05_PLAKH|nr:uncharacterized protein PKNH_0916000 [Plasmodium knowlesi strain H]OTN65183.1 putative Insulinase [Plasmodium knowlesi]CAA9988207.1 insulinase, putative [Plasmodium knowlesi strain H]SBO20129.1 insulinase, putative [Plasmodium knowlesi strain H]SBO20606.1 insulinase, putative [Plasmodium knowlesi strain H]VVS77681.1 insulinase, putative [Plasmodium knowlesi strain H]|eukprot:XP_002259184.1 [Plasmodium knowlesi strain H]